MHRVHQDKAQMLSDTVQSSGIDAEMLSVVLREGAWRGLPLRGCVRVCKLPYKGRCQTKADHLFPLHLFL